MNTNRSATIKLLLQKYKAGQCSPEEEAQIEAWLQQLGNEDLTNVTDISEQRVLRRIRKQVLNNIKPVSNPLGHGLYPYIKIAAVLLLIPAAILLYSKYSKPNGPASQQYTTARGERKTLMLPDSTTVVLNSSSVLTISNEFGKTIRAVSLTGEGYFHVKHDASKPFIVTTGKLQTRVLGTQFNVHAYTNDDDYKIAVVGGRVRVSENSSPQHIVALGKVLTRNLMLTYSQKTHKHMITTVNADKLSAWQHGELYFEEASISEIAQTLSRTYNINVQLADRPAHNYKYTIGFNKQPIEKVLRVLGELTGITYQLTNSQVIINSKNCH
jgi:ferric-dicitrate binding protein FerR (iron transport regulator)